MSKDRVPGKGVQEVEGFVGDVIHSLHQEVAGTHGWVKDFQVEERVNQFPADEVGLAVRFGFQTLFSERLLALEKGAALALSFAKLWTYRFELLLEHRSHRVLDDIGHDVVRGVIGAGGLALAPIIFKVEMTFSNDMSL